ncbi:NarL family two-protein response regulator [Phaeovibrio sulfidiphilus]|uniref:NarL family two-protein response regulator n=1 Tax=Phaeovibrio sulfidiphilus TaxID=1220600 RepID=A0A8J6YZ78_9PROT|nr:NarL family two-protein response regulator [Phaeovibrio sulfidiphilus]MBE1237268.1 NarL family two-protein response regulator [Phaeovibrio sulfidiphilus]
MLAQETPLHVVVASLDSSSGASVANDIREHLPTARVEDVDLSRFRDRPLCPPEGDHPSGRVDLVVLVLPETFRVPEGSHAALAEMIGQFEACGPVLVVLEHHDDDLGIALLRAGADDWVLRSGFEPASLLYRMVWRHRVHQETSDSDISDSLSGEAERLLEMLSPNTTPITTRTFTYGTVRKVLPDLFATFLEKLNALVDLAVEDRIYGSSSRVETDLIALSESLGFVRAGPRDVIDLYVTVLKERIGNGPAKRQALVMEEMRLLVLRLMGHLANHYRLRVIGAPLRKGERGDQR